MKIGMTSLTLRNYNVEEVIQAAKDAGISGIEWGVSNEHIPLCDEKQAKRIQELSKKYDIGIFSLGSYCYMETKKECDDTLKTAKLLNAPIIRVWAGQKSPEECDNIYRNMIIENTCYMAKEAEKNGIILGFEFHHKTLTETAESAIWLIREVGKKNVGLYWQPRHYLSAEENIRERNLVLPYCVGNMHIQNYKEGYKPLSDIKEHLIAYFSDIKDENYQIMIEFVKDSKIESFMEDAAVLKEIL